MGFLLNPKAINILSYWAEGKVVRVPAASAAQRFVSDDSDRHVSEVIHLFINNII